MWLPQKCLLACALLLVTATAGFTQTFTWEDKARDGNTRGSATVTMDRDCNNPRIRYSFNARKTGINGSGRALMTFVLLNQDGSVAYAKNQSLTMGATLSGLNRKSFSQEEQFFDCNFFGAAGGYLKVSVIDRNWAKDVQSIAQDVINNITDEVRAMGIKEITSLSMGGELIPF